MDREEFFLSMSIVDRQVNLSWEVIIVYVPADHSRSVDFLAELKNEVERYTTPVVVARDFNLIQQADDKSSMTLDRGRMRMFNDCIADLALWELAYIGARFTWTNKQMDHIRSVVDRVLVSMQWEVMFPLCSLRAVTWIGADHVAVLLSSGDDAPPKPRWFHFKPAWLMQPRFMALVCNRSVEAVASPPHA
ncbi:hypothetical protein D1007_20632 [Hordeum vulgare]|nr:hypothetical protein D1007_20632 [Hordeum vulgare]